MKTISSFLSIILILYFQNISVAQSIEVDKSIGYEYAQKVIKDMGVYQDQELSTYIDCVGQNLVGNIDDRKFGYQFFVVENIEPNAFALPGGYIFITTGLLPIIQTEDELACILSHEIIHSHHRHTVSQFKKGIIPRLLEVPGNLLGILSKDLESIFNAPIKSTNALYMASHGRKNETEADLEGMELAAKSGYNPAALKDILHRMSVSIELVTGEAEQKSYFNDHPYTPDRINAIDLQSTFMEKEPSSSFTKNYSTKIDGLLFGESVYKGVFDQQTFLHPIFDFKVTFPAHWNLVNQPDFVGGYNPNGKEGIIVTLEKEKDIMEAALSFMEELSEDEKNAMITKGYFANGETNGYLMTFEGELNKEKKYANIGWVLVNNYVYKITSFTYKPDDSSFEYVVETLLPLEKKDYRQIHTHKIIAVQAKKGETLQQLCKRKDNKANIKLIGILNDLGVNERLQEGQWVKIVNESPYYTEVEVDHEVAISK
ncbi:M48 family metalloprotease [Flammeovirga sp. EKP202]|uniref:M48 family metalloprotease n=1 Tax=Flammeovirga sp. EKP202 TaxID=2770592 RepID=UPI00166006D7|nr:M48 family metalloprotease [Flammeovirga sp. EKP202]MBD0399787.1 M48 family metalloprotease [Flammeovirga sp. EKP202]